MCNRLYKPFQFQSKKMNYLSACLYVFTLSLLKEPVILFLRELRVLFTLVPFSVFSVRSSSSSSFLAEKAENKIHKLYNRSS